MWSKKLMVAIAFSSILCISFIQGAPNNITQDQKALERQKRGIGVLGKAFLNWITGIGHHNWFTGCNKGKHGIPCCPQYVIGDMEGGSEVEVSFSPKTEASCQNACKEKHPTSVGVTLIPDESRCYCEFGPILLNGNDKSYITCVFVTTKPGITDGTCYQDDGSRLLDTHIDSATNTPEECKKSCASRGYAFAGVQYTVECFCGNDGPPASRIRDSLECDAKCPGDAALMCGGTWRMNIYKANSGGCNEGGYNIPSCPEYVTGDMEGGTEVEMSFNPKTEASCQNACKEKYPTSVGVTLTPDDSRCYCEFAPILLNGNDKSYKTCVFSTVGKSVADCERMVHEPHVLVYKYTNAYDIIWKDTGSGGSKDGAIWRPKNYQSDFCLLGDVATDGYNAPSEDAIVVSAKKSRAVVHPTSFSQVWKDRGSGAYWDCAVYKMNAPAGYTCLGGVAMRSHSSQPDRNKYCCVKNDYIVLGEVQLVYDDVRTGSYADLSLWTVIRGTNVHGLDGGNFVPVNGYGKPSHGYLLKGDEVNVKSAWSLEAQETKPLKLYEVSELKEIWNDGGSGASADVSIWRAETKNDYYSVGDIAVSSHSKPHIGFLLKPSTAQYNDAIRAPVSYSEIWNDGGSGARRDVTIWRVNCPGGYIALGNVATDGAKPGLWAIACVNSRYVETGYHNGNSWQLIWRDHGSGARKDVSIFQAKGDEQTQQTVRGIGAIASHSGYPVTPYLLKKSEHTYSSEKPIERIEMSNVQYDLKAEKKLPAKPVSLKTISIINHSNIEQRIQQTISYEKSESHSFTFTRSIQLGVELKYTAGIPDILGDETTIIITSTKTFSTGESTTTKTSESVTAHVQTPGNSKITATVIANEYTADIPYTAHIKKIYYDGSVREREITGVYHGVSVSDVTVTYGEIEKKEKNVK